ncbi:MAG: hypothetical protein J5744_00750 [Oscillospiraceae bacterium]|nr:hypothetical protein [Oscillospiraceae bacterium]
MAADTELIRRAEDLLGRCRRISSVTHSHFLTPAEQYAVKTAFANRADARIVFSGGVPGTDRNVAFFLPDWYGDDDPSAECIRAVRITAGFGAPSHRDYLGAVLALGIKREWIGDILIDGSTAYLMCMDSVLDTVLLDLDHVSRFGVKREEIPLSEVPPPVIRKKEVTFTAQSPRLDAVTGAMFGISRSAAARYISEGLVSLNYSVCTSADARISPGDTISLRGKGKGVLAEEGGISRKGRTFYTADIYI